MFNFLVSYLLLFMKDQSGNIMFGGGDSGGDSAGGEDTSGGSDDTTPPTNSGGAGASDESGSGSDEDTAGGNSDSNQSSGGSFDFPEGLPDELKTSKMFDAFKDHEKGTLNYGNILKTFAHQQKLIGGDKVLVPTKDFTEDQLNEFYDKIGRPAVTDYANLVKNNVGEGQEQNKEFFDGFLKTAHSNGVLPKQAQAISDYLNKAIEAQVQQSQVNLDNHVAQGKANLEKEWGNAFEQNAKVAEQGFLNFADDSDIKYFKEAGMLSDPVVVKFLHKVGKGLGEETTFNDESRANIGLSPAEIKEKITLLWNSDKFQNKAHAQNSDAKKEYMHLQEMLHGNKKVLGK